MRFYVGTSGYSYKERRGSFYPDDLKPAQMLGYYAGRLKSVEINNTFYRMPTRKLLDGWSEQVPEDFSFVLKASRKITHFKRLKDAGDELTYLLETSALLGSRLGPTLFQLPPYLKKDAERLGAFLELLPTDVRAALEFRDPSWFDDEIFELLRASDRALVIADTGGEKDPPFEATAGWGYLRLRREDYSNEELAEWAERVVSQEWSDAFVFFKHEDEAAGPRMAEKFEGLLATAAAPDRSS
jgi:uncharacterized protein YecE (DUF72 family)